MKLVASILNLNQFVCVAINTNDSGARVEDRILLIMILLLLFILVLNGTVLLGEVLGM